MKTIVLVGVPGCGKSSILKEVEALVQVVNYGDQMLAVGAREGLNRDKLRKLPVLEQREIGIKAAKKIMAEKKGTILIDTHALIRTDVGFCPGLPAEVLEILSPSALAWIECKPSLIIERRASDVSRKRDLESEEELRLHQELVRSYLAACSAATGAILCRIVNDSPSIAENAKPLIRLI